MFKRIALITLTLSALTANAAKADIVADFLETKLCVEYAPRILGLICGICAGTIIHGSSDIVKKAPFLFYTGSMLIGTGAVAQDYTAAQFPYCLRDTRFQKFVRATCMGLGFSMNPIVHEIAQLAR